MAIGSFRSGKGGQLFVVDQALRGKKWSVKESGTKLDTTNFECFTTQFGSSGAGGGRSFSQGLIGIETAACSYSGDWDASLNPLDDPPGLFPRDDGPQMSLFPNRVDANPYAFFETLITDCSVDCDVTGLVSFDFSFENQGPYTRPEGSFE